MCIFSNGWRNDFNERLKRSTYLQNVEIVLFPLQIPKYEAYPLCMWNFNIFGTPSTLIERIQQELLSAMPLKRTIALLPNTPPAPGGLGSALVPLPQA